MSEARTDDRLDRLEEDVREIKAMLTGLVPLINRIDAQLPHLATNAELADLRGETRTGFADLRGELRSGLAVKPSHAYLWVSWPRWSAAKLSSSLPLHWR